ncbi:substrate-binding domain-containing protein [Candidatus Pyrohabitans sp.]
MKAKQLGLVFAVLLLMLSPGCTAQKEGAAPEAVAEEAAQNTPEPGEMPRLVLATTTSTYNSGLLGVLNSEFQKRYGVLVEVHAVGTGAALRMARDGEADVVLVHARAKEDRFLEDGYGINRRNVMYNDFVIVGPRSDPAGIRGMKSAAQAFTRIAQAKAKFLSRGDGSGTNAKEQEIWRLAGITPSGEWYEQTGQGMGRTLTIASEKQAYTLTDRGTFLAYKGKLELEVLVEGPVRGGDPVLANPYAVIAVNPKKYPERNYELAMLYIGFLTSPEGQRLIAEYRKNGEQLFYPDALVDRENYNQYLPVTIHGLYDEEGEPYTGVTLPPRG